MPTPSVLAFGCARCPSQTRALPAREGSESGTDPGPETGYRNRDRDRDRDRMPDPATGTGYRTPGADIGLLLAFL